MCTYSRVFWHGGMHHSHWNRMILYPSSSENLASRHPTVKHSLTSHSCSDQSILPWQEPVVFRSTLLLFYEVHLSLDLSTIVTTKKSKTNKPLFLSTCHTKNLSVFPTNPFFPQYKAPIHPFSLSSTNPLSPTPLSHSPFHLYPLPLPNPPTQTPNPHPQHPSQSPTPPVLDFSTIHPKGTTTSRVLRSPHASPRHPLFDPPARPQARPHPPDARRLRGQLGQLPRHRLPHLLGAGEGSAGGAGAEGREEVEKAEARA